MINISDKVELLIVFPIKHHASFWVEIVFIYLVIFNVKRVVIDSYFIDCCIKNACSILSNVFLASMDMNIWSSPPIYYNNIFCLATYYDLVCGNFMTIWFLSFGFA